MPATIQFPNPVKFDTLTLVAKLRGVDVYIHWTVLVIGALMVWGAIHHPWSMLAAAVAWLALMFLHESGHMLAAQHKGCHVFSIELYPIFGLCRFQDPWSRFDHCVIAWGGVVAQCLIAVPLMFAIDKFGYSKFGPINAFLFILGPYSLFVVALNLVPFGGLDGAVAWRIIPEAIKQARLKKKKKAATGDWRSY